MLCVTVQETRRLEREECYLQAAIEDYQGSQKTFGAEAHLERRCFLSTSGNTPLTTNYQMIILMNSNNTQLRKRLEI